MLSTSLFDTKKRPILAKTCPLLRLDSTLQELCLWECQTESYYLGKQVAEKLQQNPLLPGVIMTEQGKFFGMISRRRFLEHLSRPYGLELFLQRPLTSLYRFAETDILVLSGDTKIVAAVRKALHRPAELVYEPIVVQTSPHDYRLLDIHELLIAQSQIHQLATELLDNTRQKLERANQKLKHLVMIDGLTQVSNRRHFDKYLEAEWRRMGREKALLSLILCDVDFFKRYNDNYGHQAGDSCLREVAATIASSVRRPADLVARYGGEEFAVILPHTDAEGAFCVAENIRQNVKQLQLTHSQSEVAPVVTLSCGLAYTIPRPETSPMQLISVADRALYEAKAKGRDQTIVKTL